MPKKKANTPAPKRVQNTSSVPNARAKAIIWVAVVAVAVVIGVMVTRPAGARVTSVSADELGRLASQGTLVVDVRSPVEYAQGHVPGATNVPYTEIASAAAPWDRGKPVAVYCLSGDRSSTAVQTLTSMGFKTIYHFDAGFQNWAGPVETGDGRTAPADTRSTAATTGPVMYEFYSDG